MQALTSIIGVQGLIEQSFCIIVFCRSLRTRTLARHGYIILRDDHAVFELHPFKVSFLHNFAEFGLVHIFEVEISKGELRNICMRERAE